MFLVVTHNLTKYYGKSRGIENVNLEVEEGEILGFIGLSAVLFYGSFRVYARKDIYA